MIDSKRGFAKGCAIGCLAVVVVVGSVVAYVAMNWEKLILKYGGDIAVLTAESMFETFGLPEEEVEAAMKPIRELVERAKAGEVSAQQVVSILEELGEGPIPGIVMARAYDVKYLEPSGLSGGSKKDGRMELSRFAFGMSSEMIPADSADELSKIIMTTTVDEDGDEEETLKASLTDDEVRQSLKIMKELSDKAGVEERAYDVDIAREIQRAIDAGLAKEESSEKDTMAQDEGSG